MTSIRNNFRPHATVGGKQIRDAVLAAAQSVRAGPGMVQFGTHEHATIRSIHRAPRFSVMWALLSFSIQLSPNRWRYGWDEAILTGDPTLVGGGWTLKTNGRNATGPWGGAFNLAEAPNTGSGVEGTGHNVDGLPGTFAMQPIPSGRPVAMWIVHSTPKTVWFDSPNAIDGSCGP